LVLAQRAEYLEDLSRVPAQHELVGQLLGVCGRREGHDDGKKENGGSCHVHHRPAQTQSNLKELLPNQIFITNIPLVNFPWNRLQNQEEKERKLK